MGNDNVITVIQETEILGKKIQMYGMLQIGLIILNRMVSTK